MLTPRLKRYLQAALVAAIAMNVALIVWLPSRGVAPAGNTAAAVMACGALWLIGKARPL